MSERNPDMCLPSPDNYSRRVNPEEEAVAQEILAGVWTHVGADRKLKDGPILSTRGGKLTSLTCRYRRTAEELFGAENVMGCNLLLVDTGEERYVRKSDSHILQIYARTEAVEAFRASTEQAETGQPLTEFPE